MKSKSRVNISITRANGRVDYIGCIKGGNWWEHLTAHIRLWIANWRTHRRR